MEGYNDKNKHRIIEVKKKKGPKRVSNNHQRLIQQNKLLPDGNQDQHEEQNLQNWALKNIAFIGAARTQWGNDLAGEEWVQNQKKIHSSNLVEPSSVNKNIHKDHKIVLLESSPLSPFLHKQSSKIYFLDSQFLPNDSSLTGQWGKLEKYKNVQWLKATQKIKNCKIFASKISPKDIIQGKLGNCYFLAGLGALAQRPDRIFNLFLTQQINQSKHFAVKILFKGKWTVVDLDELFPFQNDKPVFSHAVRHELWVMILQKAWAKLYSSYMRISAGVPEQPLHDLTGAPIKFFKLKSSDLNKQQLWKYLMKASKKQYAMCVSSNKGSDEKMSQTGIVQGHAYTVLNATLLNYQGKQVKLLQLRNPWGRKQSFGDWSDKDPKWKKISNEDKQRLGFNPDLDDGIFYIQFEQFLIEYRAVTVAEVNDNASYVYETAKDPNINGIYFKVDIRQTGHYSFQVDKTPKRVLNSKQQIGYKYPQAIVKIFSTFQSYKQVHHFEDTQRLTSSRYSMYKGIYIVFAYIQFQKQFEKDYDVNLAVYSEVPVVIDIATKKQISKIPPITLRLKSPINKKMARTSKSKAKSNPKNNANDSQQKVNAITFNYIMKAKQIKNNVSQQPEKPGIIDHKINIQIKQKRQNKKGFIHLGGKTKQQVEKNSKKHWGNNVDGQQWINQQAQNQSSQFIEGIGKSILQVIEKQVTFIQPCPSQETIQQSKLVKKDFIDDRFPPNLSSLTGQWGQIPQWKNVRWQRISKVMPKAQIFKGKISPQSIKQGFLGDCYFLAGIAALAERPDRIFNLFLNHQRNQANYYSVKMLYKGKWLTINMDDYIPYMYDLPAFSRANPDELWVIILEKAWAKIYSSFKRIEAGFPEQTLHDLTGAPIKHLYLQRSSFNIDRQWSYLMNASKVEYAMVASSQNGSDTLKSVSGIVQGHAYTLLGVAQITFNNKIQRIVQLRNPWGKGEGVGRWSDNDPNWNLLDEKTKAELKYSKAEDGIFYMTYQAFCKQFKIITIAEINDHASYIYKSAKDPNLNGCYFKVHIVHKGRYSFQVDSTPERTFQIKYNTSYRYPNIKFQLGMDTDKGYIKRITTMQSNLRTSFYVDQFQPGIYYCFVRIDFDKKFQKDFDVNLAIYGDYACNIQFATRKQAIKFSNNPNISWMEVQPSKQSKNQNQWCTLRSYRSQKYIKRH